MPPTLPYASQVRRFHIIKRATTLCCTAIIAISTATDHVKRASSSSSSHPSQGRSGEKARQPKRRRRACEQQQNKKKNQGSRHQPTTTKYIPNSPPLPTLLPEWQPCSLDFFPLQTPPVAAPAFPAPPLTATTCSS